MSNPNLSAQIAAREQAWIEYRDSMAKRMVSRGLSKRDFLAGYDYVEVPYDSMRRAQLIHMTVELKAQLIEARARIAELEKIVANVRVALDTKD